MNKMDSFKEYVKKNPSLIKSVRNGEMTWQKYYEIFDLYGEDENIWKDYLTKDAVATAATGFGIIDVLSYFKNMDLTKMQEGINSVQRVIGVLQDFGSKDTTKKAEYKPRPLYKHFED